MKKVKRFLTALLCVCALAALTAVAASAYGEQEAHIALDDTPQIGRVAPKKADAYVISDFVVKRVDWVGELDSGKFKANTKYTALITLTLRDSSKSIDPDNFVAYVNNQLIKTAYQETDTEIIVPVEYAAITPVEEVEITLTAPAAGKTPATTAKLPSGAKYEVKKVEWKGTLANGKFKADTEYTANVTLGIKSGTNAGFDDKDLPVYVNGQLIDSYTWKNGAEIVVPAEFAKTPAAASPATELKKVEVTLTAPVAGATPAATASVPSGASYTVEDVVWTQGDLSTGKFLANTEYAAEITLAAKGTNTVFASSGFAAYVNGGLIKDVIRSSDGTKIVFLAEFTKTGAAQSSSGSPNGTAIGKIQLTVDAPAWGEKPAATASVPSTAHTEAKSVKWSGQLDIDGTFMPRVKYTVTITMGIKSGANYYFSDKTNSLTVTVNGKSADAYWLASDKVEVIYTFPETNTGTTGIISVAKLTIDGPAAGEKPASTAHIASTASTYVKSVRWEGALDSSGRFQAGTEYTAYITLAMKENGRKFSTSTFDATVNGVLLPAETLTRVSDKELIIPVPFEKTPGTAPSSKPSTIPATGTAYASTQMVDIDGKKVEFQMYALRDAAGNPTNYIKVRDLALALNSTRAQFNVVWDGAVNLVAGRPYTSTGTENSTPFRGNRAYRAATSATNVNSAASDLTAIILTDDNGGDYTYYQLRDLGRKLGFNVSWSSARGVFVETDKPYSEN